MQPCRHQHSCDAVVIGGGFYGCMIAQHLRRYFSHVVLLEKQSDLLQRASYANQARIHNGYHYPRSLLTAMRARANFPRFVETFRPCIDDSFDKYYAIARHYSKVTAQHFANLCRRIGAPLEEAPPAVQRLFVSEMVEAVFRVQEYAFDAVRLKQRMQRQLSDAQVDVRLNTCVEHVAGESDGSVRLTCRRPAGDYPLVAGRAFLCSYSRINTLLAGSGLPTIPLKHELTEMALVEMPDSLRRVGITVMCGPFFSVMPFPPRGLHTFSHVRYTPHSSWTDSDGAPLDGHAYLDQNPRQSHFTSMQRDAQRFLPELAGCRQLDSLWEIKTVLQVSERDDSRPILFSANAALPNLISVLASKIDNVFDALDEIDARYFQPPSESCPSPRALSPSSPLSATIPASRPL
jgi:glycine/D-amino acid oxidase-like deaminating enzyme